MRRGLTIAVLTIALAFMSFVGTTAEAKCFWVDEYDIYGNHHSKLVCSGAFDRPAPREPKIELPFITTNPAIRGYNEERQRQNMQRESDTLDQLRQLQFQLELQEFRRAQDARIRSKLIALEALRKLAREEKLLAEERLVLDEYLVRNGLKQPGISIRDWWYGARSPGSIGSPGVVCAAWMAWYDQLGREASSAPPMPSELPGPDCDAWIDQVSRQAQSIWPAEEVSRAISDWAARSQSRQR